MNLELLKDINFEVGILQLLRRGLSDAHAIKDQLAPTASANGLTLNSVNFSLVLAGMLCAIDQVE